MRLIIDHREHDLIEKCQQMIDINPNYTRVETDALPIGDILMKTDECKDVLIIERKTLQDLLASIKDRRYEEQSHRLKHASGFAPHNVFYLIEGMFSSLRTPLEKKLVISAMASLSYFKGFSIIRTSGLQETADVLIHMADKIDRNFMDGKLPWYLVRTPSHAPAENIFLCDNPENPVEEQPLINNAENPSYSGFVKKVKKENITPENIGEILLCQIPGISTLYAQSVLKTFGGFFGLLQKLKDGSAQFENITYESKGKVRRIPKTCGEEILRFLKNL
jgi:ERCC4-type nuclease